VIVTQYLFFSPYICTFHINIVCVIVESPRDVPYGAKHSLSMLGEACTGVRAQSSPSMINECLGPYGTSLGDSTIAHCGNTLVGVHKMYGALGAKVTYFYDIYSPQTSPISVYTLFRKRYSFFIILYHAMSNQF
jgi:hypothetical protein